LFFAKLIQGQVFSQIELHWLYICIYNRSKNWQWIKRTTQHWSIIYTA
jgi:hypothetical protein